MMQVRCLATPRRLDCNPPRAAYTQRAAAENAVTADPAHYTVELENDEVRIIRIKYGPGEKSVMHEHGPGAT